MNLNSNSSLVCLVLSGKYSQDPPAGNSGISLLTGWFYQTVSKNYQKVPKIIKNIKSTKTYQK